MTTKDFAIVFVPGIRAKPRPEEHVAQLRLCVRAGAVKAGATTAEADALAARFDLVGWSHEFYGEYADISVDMPGIERLLAAADVPAEALADSRSWRRRINGFMYGLVERWPLLGRHFSTARMQSRVAEIDRYFNDTDGAATAARAKVAAHLRAAWDQQQKLLLVGHSFGSVIAWDTLWQLSQERSAGPVELFLTLGNPMTMSYIRAHLLGLTERGTDRYPTGIKRWHNINAIGEPTALGRGMGTLFADMVAAGNTEGITDDLTLINQFRGPDGLNVHKCYGYFANEQVGQVLVDWLRRLDSAATA